MAHAYYKSCSALIDKLFLAMNSIQAAIEILIFLYTWYIQKVGKTIPSSEGIETQCEGD